MRDDILEAELKQALAECESLRAENARLRVRLGESPKPAAVHLPTNNVTTEKLSDTVTADSPPEQKMELFRSLFRGRDDVYAVRWHGKSGKTGYSPAGTSTDLL